MQLGSTLHAPVFQDLPIRPPVQRQPLEDALTRQQQPVPDQSRPEQSRPQRRVIETLSAEQSRNNPQKPLSKDDVSSPRVRQALDSFAQVESFVDDGLGTLLEGIDIRV